MTRLLLGARVGAGHWEGELSTSPLSTATAVVALELVRKQGRGDVCELIEGGLRFLADSRNEDGGWGDTLRSVSNISTTMLANAAFHATNAIDRFGAVVEGSSAYIERAGGVAAVRARYGKDRTFSVPILTHCAIAGVVDWREVAPLPFELACLSPVWFSRLKLPVVSYALPALIAIGQARHHHRRPLNPLTRIVRDWSRARSLRVLEKIQPAGGGFLEATPLTAFVTMSLASIGLADHPVTRRAVDFLIRSVRPDGSWPIDTNLATWVTTLSVEALGEELPPEAGGPIVDWLLRQQYRERHPYTNAAPGGWAWTDLPGGVPDADDTPGAMLALRRLEPEPSDETIHAVRSAARWLVDLQNRDGGWPTFCRGWGYLPFDRSAPDLTAHALRALGAWRECFEEGTIVTAREVAKALRRGWSYLERTQRADGAWLPLWFGNQYCRDDENPTYGTARVLAAYRDLDSLETSQARRGLQWLIEQRNADGGWGGGPGAESSIEETALAVDVLLADAAARAVATRGIEWLLERVEEGTIAEPTPIGFYFAKLWYFEKLYPIIFSTAALARACRTLPRDVDATLPVAAPGVTSRTSPSGDSLVDHRR